MLCKVKTTALGWISDCKRLPLALTFSCSKRLKDAQCIFTVVRRDMCKLSEQEVPALIKENAASQLTKILQGDYDLKIARQDYFTSNQDQVSPHLAWIACFRETGRYCATVKFQVITGGRAQSQLVCAFIIAKVIQELVIQRSRNEFLTMAYEIEAKGHRDTHHLLTAVSMLLQKNNRALNSRLVSGLVILSALSAFMAFLKLRSKVAAGQAQQGLFMLPSFQHMMRDPNLLPTRHQRATIDSRDTSLIRLHKLMG